MIDSFPLHLLESTFLSDLEIVENIQKASVLKSVSLMQTDNLFLVKARMVTFFSTGVSGAPDLWGVRNFLMRMSGEVSFLLLAADSGGAGVFWPVLASCIPTYIVYMHLHERQRCKHRCFQQICNSFLFLSRDIVMIYRTCLVHANSRSRPDLWQAWVANVAHENSDLKIAQGRLAYDWWVWSMCPIALSCAFSS